MQEVNLRSTHANYNLASMEIADGRKLAIAEIQEMFKLLEKSPQIRLAFAWMPCRQCANINSKYFCMERVCDIRLFLYGRWKFQKVNIGKGVAGRVLESENKMCYFKNLGDYSILDHPWAHDAQENRFETCFAICLQSSCSENDLYVLEFFMSPGCNGDGYPWSYLSFLLSIMERNLKSFKVASGQHLGEHLLFQTIGSGEEDKLLSNTVQNVHETDHTKNFEQEENIIGTNSNEGNVRNESKTGFHIGYKDLEPHFGKRLEDAANDLGVSRSTLKRARKECGIRRWPSNMKNKKNPSLFQTRTSTKHVTNSGQQISKASCSNLPISGYPIESNVPQTCIETTREGDKTCHEENNAVTIKAKFKEDTIKFDLCLSSGLEKLVEEVAKRLNLMLGNFKLKYMDDDDDLILLTCDEDLHNHVKSMRSLGKTTVHVLVHLVFD